MYCIRDLSRLLQPILVMIILLTCCTRYDSDECCQGDHTATLSLNLSIPEVEATVKSVSSDPSDPSKWTSWEKVVDGRYLYRVTAFLLKGDRLVSSKDLKLDGEPTEVVLEFEGNFTHGAYTLMVVANYSEYQAEDGSNGIRKYEGMKDFTATVESILGRSAIENFTSEYEDTFIKYDIESFDGICAALPQALTMVKSIELHPGVNFIDGELVRTYSRIRISAENQSDEELKISSLSFSNIFTQRRAYLFPGNGYIQDKVSLDVDSPYALTPFIATDSAPFSIEGKKTAVVFDAYILESSRVPNDEEYNYVLDLGYDGTKGFKLRSTNPIKKRNDVSSGYYIIYNTNSESYLTVGNNSVGTGNSLPALTKGMNIPEEYVWSLDKGSLSSYQFYIGTAEAQSNGQTSYYMSNPTSSSVPLGPNKSVYFTFGDASSYLSMRSSGSGRYYITVSNNKVSGRSSTNTSTRFYLYSLDLPASASSTFKIPLKTIDKTSGQSVLIDRIERNDFINVVVLVKYNKNHGHFEFEVKNWDTAGGDVEFN